MGPAVQLKAPRAALNDHTGFKMSLRRAHAEAAANAVVGLALIEAMLWAFGVALVLAWKLNLCGMLLSNARSFVLRLIFARLE
jgi:hypothetical protein